MLGKYGETLVVDWGLAKHVDESESQLPKPTASLPDFAGPDDATMNLTRGGQRTGNAGVHESRSRPTAMD